MINFLRGFVKKSITCWHEVNLKTQVYTFRKAKNFQNEIQLNSENLIHKYFPQNYAAHSHDCFSLRDQRYCFYLFTEKSGKTSVKFRIDFIQEPDFVSKTAGKIKFDRTLTARIINIHY